MELSKRLLLLNHLHKFICEEFASGKDSEEVILLLKHKSIYFQNKLKDNSITKNRKDYLENYSLYLNKRAIDFQYFRRKEILNNLSDFQLFGILNLIDKIIFRKFCLNY